MVHHASAPVMEESLAWLALALLEVLPRQAYALAERFGSAQAVLRVPADALLDAGVSSKVATGRDRIERRLQRELAALDRADARLVAWSDPAYPTRLRQIPDPPLVLAVRGG